VGALALELNRLPLTSDPISLTRRGEVRFDVKRIGFKVRPVERARGEVALPRLDSKIEGPV
jgi:hypothetical protein